MDKKFLTGLTMSEARRGLRSKHFSAVELTEAYIAAMARHRELNAYITETPDIAIVQARIADEKIAKGEQRLLEGLPLGIKDLFCTKGIRTTAGSRMLDNFVPEYESTVTQNLLNEGAVTLGKLNMDEFAMGSSNLTSAYGPCINPLRRVTDPDVPLVPGGSSGGSASAVAGKMAIAATGTDTGGSIRQPASFTGIVGLKPTYGLCSRYGIVAFASSLDQAGPMTRTVEDCALLLQVMAGYDPKDSTSLHVPKQSYYDGLTANVKGLTVGIPEEYLQGLNPEMTVLVEKGIDWLKQQGIQIKNVKLPSTEYALLAYYIVAPAEASSNLARYDGVRFGYRAETDDLNTLYKLSRREGFGHEVRRRIMIGTYVLSAGYYDAYYIKAQKVRTLIAQDFDRAFKDVDVILTPTTPTDAFGIDERPTDPITMFLNDIYTVTVNLAGLPAISVPCGFSKRGMPLGLQLIGPSLSEQRLLNVALALEDAANFDEQLKTFHD